MVLCSLLSFHFRSHQGVCNTPLRFSCDAETNGFLHLDLRNCFTINDEFANGEHLFTGRQWCFRDRKQWIESRAKSICHLRNEDCFMRKTAIATAIMKLSLAQTLIATAIMKLSLRHWGISNRDGALHIKASLSPHLRWKHCRQNKRLEATAK